MADYPAGSIKRDPATGAVAIRTSFPEVGDLAIHAWLVATKSVGAHTKTTPDVEAWDTIYTPSDE